MAAGTAAERRREREVDRAAAEATLVQRLTAGDPLEVAVLATVRALTTSGLAPRARALAGGLGEATSGTLASLARGYADHLRGRSLAAAEAWRQVPDDELARWVPLEAVQALLLTGDADDRAAACRVAAHVEGDARALVAVAARLVVVGEHDAARAVLARLGPQAGRRLGPAGRRSLALVREALAADPPSVPPGAVVVGVLDYLQPEIARGSKNIGDYVQTLAMLGNLVRFDVAFSGQDGLGEVAAACQQVVPPSLRVAAPPAQVHLVPVHRDFSSGQSLPDPTWLVAFGWYMHPACGLRFDLPFNPALRPLFVSFHVSNPAVLTPQALAYLRQYGPVGCRDWTTVYLLRSEGVDAFFSGCLTTTVDAVVPADPDARPDALALVDLAATGVALPGERTVVVHQADPALRLTTAAEGLQEARRALKRYRSEFARVATSRLHSYLPATSLGLPVHFAPRNNADPRFSGLAGLTPTSPEFVRMRDGLRALLAGAVTSIVSGADESEVYQGWRDRAAPLVEQARARHAAPVSVPPPVSLDDVVRTVRDAAGSWGAVSTGALDVVVAVPARRAGEVEGMLASLRQHASAPLRLWVLSRGLDLDAGEGWARAFPDVAITQLRCDVSRRGTVGAGVPPATLDRALLPLLLDSVGRALLLDVGAPVAADPSPLLSLDLEGRSVAARPTGRAGYRFWWRAANRLPAQQADELRRMMTQRPTLHSRYLDEQVLLLDLEALRRAEFSQTYLPWARAYGFSFGDLLMVHTAGDYLPLDAFGPAGAGGAEPPLSG
jgi:hypothetical protein